MSDEEVNAAALSDPDNLPRTPEREKHLKRVPQLKLMRRALGLSQEAFAARFRIPLGTLRDWEQGKTEADQAARAYLTVIARNPKAVTEALNVPMPTMRFLKQDCPHIWALLNQRAKRNIPKGIVEFLSGPDIADQQNWLRLADQRIAGLIRETSERKVGDVYRRRLSGVATKDELAETLCEITIVEALSRIPRSDPELQPQGQKGKCEVRVTINGTHLCAEVKRLHDDGPRRKPHTERAITRAPAKHPNVAWPRAKELSDKLGGLHRKFPHGTLNVLFLFHMSWGSPALYIRQLLFGDPRTGREIVSALNHSTEPDLREDGLYALLNCGMCRPAPKRMSHRTARYRSRGSGRTLMRMSPFQTMCKSFSRPCANTACLARYPFVSAS
jgi:putative transcriptional regulator